MSGPAPARGVLAALVVAAVLAGCGGGGDRTRDAIRSYIDNVNAIQREGDSGMADANTAYVAFSRGELGGREAVRRLTTAADELRAIRGRLAAVEVPVLARGLRTRLLGVFDADIELAGEAELLARYVPAARAAMAPLPRASRRLRSRLAAAESPDAQNSALGLYAAALDRLENRMRLLSPPPVLLASHRSQLLRLHEARVLSGRLRTAIAGADAPAIARLLLRFREVNASTGAGLVLQRGAVRAYRQRVRDVQEAIAAARREQARLQRTLG
jgi:hypothetical protein